MKTNATYDKNKNRSISFRVKMSHNFTEPYSYNEEYIDKLNSQSLTNQVEYVVYDEKTFYNVLNEFFDAPKKPLTSKDIHKDFDSPGRVVSDAKVEMIKNYYNGRFKFLKKIHDTLKNVNFSKITHELPFTMKFNIPFELNFFSCEDDDKHENHVSMNDAFIEIEISRIDSN